MKKLENTSKNIWKIGKLKTSLELAVGYNVIDNAKLLYYRTVDFEIPILIEASERKQSKKYFNQTLWKRWGETLIPGWCIQIDCEEFRKL